MIILSEYDENKSDSSLTKKKKEKKSSNLNDTGKVLTFKIAKMY